MASEPSYSFDCEETELQAPVSCNIGCGRIQQKVAALSQACPTASAKNTEEFTDTPPKKVMKLDNSTTGMDGVQIQILIRQKPYNYCNL